MKITYTLSIQQWQQWHKDRKVILNFTNGSIVIHLYYVNFLYGKIPIYQCAAQIICTDCGFRIELSVQFNSVAQSCPTLCNPMNRNTPGLPVHHQLPESVMPYSHLILCHPLLFLPPIPPSIRVFSNALLGRCKSKLQWDITSHRSEWPSSKSLQTINTGEGMEKRECFCTVSGNVNWYSHYGRRYGDSLKN